MHSRRFWLSLYSSGVKYSVILKFQSVVPSSKEILKWFGHNHAETLEQVAVLCVLSLLNVCLLLHSPMG